MHRLSDEELIQRSRNERGAAAEAPLNVLFERHHAKVAAWCLRITRDANAATDLAQEIFIKAFQRLHSFQGNAKFSTWLYSITRNHCLDELRARSSRPQHAPDSLLEEIPDVLREGATSALERQQSEELLRTLMTEALDETEHKVLTLHYLHELPLDSVAKMLSLTNPSGAKAYIVSAKRKLKRAYEQWNARQKQAMK